MFGLSEGDGMTLLSPYRALDLTDEGGHLAGHILARLGADVIAVDPPGGSPVRRLGPFAPDGSSSHLWSDRDQDSDNIAMCRLRSWQCTPPSRRRCAH